MFAFRSYAVYMPGREPPNNELTAASGFAVPADAPADVVRTSVGTDPGLALLTRKGTGYDKVPSLKGVWYRGHYRGRARAANCVSANAVGGIS